MPSCVQNRPDVVILSTNLPDRSAGGVYRKLRANLKTKDIPVLFLSEGKKSCRELEILELRKEDEVIKKPFDIEEIKSYVERMIPHDTRGPGSVLWQSD
jgi:DNA-binding response OmpR family regulator